MSDFTQQDIDRITASVKSNQEAEKAKKKEERKSKVSKWIIPIILVLMAGAIIYLLCDRYSGPNFVEDGIRGGWTEEYDKYKSDSVLRAAFGYFKVVDEAEIKQLVARERRGESFKIVVPAGTTILNSEVTSDGYKVFNYTFSEPTECLVDLNGNIAVKCNCGNPIKLVVKQLVQKQKVVQNNVIQQNTVIVMKQKTVIEYLPPIIQTVVKRVNPPCPPPYNPPHNNDCSVPEYWQHNPANPSTQPVQQNIAPTEYVPEVIQHAEEVQEQQFSEPAGGLEPTTYGTPGDGNPGYYTPEAVTITPSGVTITAPAPTTQPVSTPMTGVTDTTGTMPAMPN